MVVYCTVDGSDAWQELCGKLTNIQSFTSLDEAKNNTDEQSIVSVPVDIIELFDFAKQNKDVEVKLVLIPLMVVMVEYFINGTNFELRKNNFISCRRALLKALKKYNSFVSLLSLEELDCFSESDVELTLFTIKDGRYCFNCDDATYLLSYYIYQSDELLGLLETSFEAIGCGDFKLHAKNINVDSYFKSKESVSDSDEYESILKQLFIVQEELEKSFEINSLLEKESYQKNYQLERKKGREILNLERKILKKQEDESRLRSQLAELKMLKSSLFWKIYIKCLPLMKNLLPKQKKRKILLDDIKLLYKSEYFDPDWYISTYPDVDASFTDPAEHYLLYGAVEGRNPSSKFDTEYYLNKYKDVSESGLNPLIHFIKFGRSENRRSC
ncbi:hypothetical protein [Alteromonas lipotrueiana]|uniref:hypothetical protein n=1 Tax=Alteromonas lipotrueiana TaxID=2803815 RepID=UPI001C47DF3E|nr:hypothetical protein [Alteromonas lipotrueiana]